MSSLPPLRSSPSIYPPRVAAVAHPSVKDKMVSKSAKILRDKIGKLSESHLSAAMEQKSSLPPLRRSVMSSAADAPLHLPKLGLVESATQSGAKVSAPPASKRFPTALSAFRFAEDASDAEDEATIVEEMKQIPRGSNAPGVDDDLSFPHKALKSLIAFEMSVEEKVAFEDFLCSGRAKTSPAMIIGYFKHFMCANSTLANELRHTPLDRIEDVVQRLSRTSSMAPFQFLRDVVEPLIGKHQFLEQDGLALFDFFDSDSDGEIDYKDVCNGFVLLRSRDGPIVPVVHRCILMISPKTRKESKLAMMTRLELIHMTSVLVSVLGDYVDNARQQTRKLHDAIKKEVPPVAPKGIEMLQLKAQQHDVTILTQLEKHLQRDVNKMLERFSCDRRGNFPYVEVREFMLHSEAIRKSISLMRVPRDDDLYKSFLSEYYRNAEVDEASTSREFRPSVRNKSNLLCGLQSGGRGGMSTRRQTFAKGNDQQHVEESCVDESRESEEHGQPEFYTLRGMLYRKLEQESVPSFITKAEYMLDDRRNSKKSSRGVAKQPSAL